MASPLRESGARAVFYCALVSVIVISAPTTTSALSVELANKCRAMALKVYPPKPPGTKGGNAQAERNYYRSCISHNGTMPDDNNKTQPAVTPPPQSK
jgi:hypothetical protein